jgi:MerR family transcriptional regulator/heat shock protein HspR
MERNEEQGLYIISIAAGLAEVHPQTLRLYERRGLLRPARTAKNRRRYSDADIDRLRRIQELTQVEGLNLSGVRKVLEMENEIVGLRDTVTQLQSEMIEMERQMREEMRELKRNFALSRRAPSSLAVRAKRGFAR